MQVYIVPFMAIGRRTTLVVDFRFRALEKSLMHDKRVIDYEYNWALSPFESIEKEVASWAAMLLDACQNACIDGFTLAESSYPTLASLIRDLESILRLYDYGYGERASCVGEFLRLLSRLNPSSNNCK